MSDVYFFDYAKGTSIIKGMDDLFTRSSIANVVSPEEPVAVKLHMGELGNVTYIRPLFVRMVVDLVKRAGGKPFVTDTTALYSGARGTPESYLATAAANGFTEASMEAPVVIADEGDEGTTTTIENPVEGCEIREAKIASRIYDADSLLVLSHAKGHAMTGFGGAVKNLGMGCVTKESKSAQHTPNTPVIDESKCDACGQCVEVCPANALSLVEGKIVRDMKLCTSCSDCLFTCPTEALSWPPGSKERLQVNIAHIAYAVLKNFKGKVGFINFIQDVTPLCDCAAPAGKPIVQDVGILASLDPVAIDKASIDLIDQAPVVVSPAPASPPDLLGKIHNVDSLIQLRTAERLGLGSLEYNQVTI